MRWAWSAGFHGEIGTVGFPVFTDFHEDGGDESQGDLFIGEQRGEEQFKEVLSQAVMGLWELVNNITRLRPSRRERFRVTLFGSARMVPGAFGYEETNQCAAELAKLGCDIITGRGPTAVKAPSILTF